MPPADGGRAPSTTTCHDIVDRATTPTTFTVALAGNPNSGKTTLFNALTGVRQKTGNCPGVTVERKIGRCRLTDGSDVATVDLPGTNSFVSRSPDEVVAMQVLRGLRPDTPVPDAVVLVVDASNLQRNLYLVSQLIELGRPMVVALNMTDVAARRGLRVSAERLSAELGVPVVPVVGHKRPGVAELKAAIRDTVVAPAPDWPLPPAMKDEVANHAALLGTDAAAGVDHTVSAEQLLVGDRADDLRRFSQIAPIRARLTAAHDRLTAAGIDPMQADIEAHYH